MRLGVPVNRLGADQARGELADRSPADRIAPFGGDGAERAKNEGALGHCGVRDGDVGVAPRAARPEQNIEVERPRAPALAGAAAELRFDFAQPGELFGRGERRGDERDGVGLAPARRPHRIAGDDRAGIDRLDLFAFERRERRDQNMARIAMARMAAV